MSTASPAHWRNARRYQAEDPADRRVLADLERQLQVLQSLDAAVWAFDTERCQCLWANAAGLEIWGAADVAQLRQRDVAATQSEAIYALVNDYLKRVLAGEKITEWVTLEINGSTRRFSHSYHPLTLADERVVLLIEARAAPTAEELLAFTADYTLTVGLFDLDGRLTSSNPAFRRLAQTQPLDDLNAILPASPPYTDWVRQIAEQNQLLFETTLETGRGQGHFRGELRRVVSQDAGPQALLTLYDLTEQRLKQSEQALNEQRARTERLLDTAEVATYSWDIEHNLITGDRRWRSRLGTDEGAPPVVFAEWARLIHPEDAARVLAASLQMLTGELLFWSHDYRIADGASGYRWILDRGVVMRRDAQGRALEIGGIHLDIEDQKRAEQALAASELRSRALLQAIPDLMCVTDLDANILDLHLSRPDDWVLPPGPLTGLNLRDVLPPEAAAMFKPTQTRVLATGQSVQGEFVNRHPTLGERFREFRMVPYGTDRTLTLVRDITDRKRAERAHEQTVKQLQQAQKMDALGQLTGGIAHDFNNILASMLGYAWLAQQQPLVMADGKTSDYLKIITSAGERGRDLVQKMLSFSRKDSAAPATPVDPLPVVEEAFRMLKSIIPSRLSLELTLPAGAPPLAIDPIDLHQVLVNLVVNSRDAMGEHGRILVGVQPLDGALGFCTSCQVPVDGRYLSFSVEDTGSGIPPDAVGRIFDPFFTTKEVGAGTGIGLSVVHGIVHRYGGHILVDSQPGTGTRIQILLPVMDASPPVAQAIEASPLSPRAVGGRLMVVDDEPWVGAFLRELLEEDGYTVDVFNDPQLALTALTQAPGKYAVVITDLTMQGMTGLELAAAIGQRDPVLPVVLCTGAGETPDAARLAKAGVRHLLPKPIPVAQLQALLAELSTGQPRA